MDMAIIPWEMVVLCGLSLCVGWGIRGNFGHEYGAALPGALAAMALVLAIGTRRLVAACPLLCTVRCDRLVVRRKYVLYDGCRV